jgi:hypothetical protein
VARAGRYFTPEHFDATFELGLGRLLQGLGVPADAPARRPRRRSRTAPAPT